MKKLHISPAPHINSGVSTHNVMGDVAIALIPASTSFLSVPPVETISKPNFSKPKQNSTIPSLLVTLTNALLI